MPSGQRNSNSILTVLFQVEKECLFAHTSFLANDLTVVQFKDAVLAALAIEITLEFTPIANKLLA